TQRFSARPDIIWANDQEDSTLAKPNYQFQKRQKELQKKKKMEEKRQRKLERSSSPSTDNPDQTPDQGGTDNKPV
ncbi:MAG: hypothetical protein AAB252_06620, partial [Pseudomonadota bacterium]